MDGMGNNPQMQSYLRFSVSGLTGTVQSAKLRVFAYGGSTNGPAVYASSSSWSETAITWNNRPAVTGAPADNRGYIADNTWVEYNVKPLVSSLGNGTYTFVLVTDSYDGTHFYSREAGQIGHGSEVPRLILTVTR